jgi:DNA polymerase-3 subunit chi
MTRIDFYFNAPGKAEVARKLAAKAFQAGQQALVYSLNANRCQELDGLFWTAQQLSFLPHVRCGHPLARRTPILIGDDPDELASADVLILMGVDAGWGLRVIPNQLYYAFFVPFAVWRLARG